MVKKLLELVNNDYDARVNGFEMLLATITNERLIHSDYLKKYTTAGVMDLARKSEPKHIIDIRSRAKMLVKFERYNNIERGKQERKALDVMCSALPNTIDISVEWKKGRYTNNPIAHVCAGGFYSVGRVIGGGGWDRKGDAIGQALSNNYSVLRILYEHYARGGVLPIGVRLSGGLPYIDGRTGVSNLCEIFRIYGYNMRYIPFSECYTVEREVK